MKPIFIAILLFVSALCFGEFSIDNIKPGETVRYPLLILKGTADGAEMAAGTSWNDAVRFPVMNHHFVAVVSLKKGKNMLLLHAGSETMKFRIDYSPIANPHKLLAVFVAASDQGNTYYSTDPKDKFQIAQKMDMAFKLMQSVTAEQMNQAGYGRKTFALELGKDGKLDIHYVKSSKTTAELRSLEPQAIYAHLNDLLSKEFPSPFVKWCGLLGFTGFDPIAKKSVGHLALGGDRQALFGGASMHLWPTSLKELPKVLANITPIDPQTTFEDSGNRGTVWANVSTALGACLHEVGHTFDLPHSSDPFSIMSRGFDYFGRQLLPMEPPIKPGPWTLFAPNQLPKWDPSQAAQLNLNHWFQPELPAHSDSVNPEIKATDSTLSISAPAGIRFVGAHNDEFADWFFEYKADEVPKSLTLSIREIREHMGAKTAPLTIVVIDSNGTRSSFELKR